MDGCATEGWAQKHLLRGAFCRRLTQEHRIVRPQGHDHVDVVRAAERERLAWYGPTMMEGLTRP